METKNRVKFIAVVVLSFLTGGYIAACVTSMLRMVRFPFWVPQLFPFLLICFTLLVAPVTQPFVWSLYTTHKPGDRTRARFARRGVRIVCSIVTAAAVLFTGAWVISLRQQFSTVQFILSVCGYAAVLFFIVFLLITNNRRAGEMERKQG